MINSEIQVKLSQQGWRVVQTLKDRNVVWLLINPQGRQVMVHKKQDKVLKFARKRVL